MTIQKTEQEWAQPTARHLKAELKQPEVTYEELAARLQAQGFEETKASIANETGAVYFEHTYF